MLINSTHHDSGTIEDNLWDKWKTIREHRFLNSEFSQYVTEIFKKSIVRLQEKSRHSQRSR